MFYQEGRIGQTHGLRGGSFTKKLWQSFYQRALSCSRHMTWLPRDLCGLDETLRWHRQCDYWLLDWLAILVSPTIKMFDELSRILLAYFLSSKRKRRTAIGLIQIVQEKRNYVARFKVATLGINDLLISCCYCHNK